MAIGRSRRQQGVLRGVASLERYVRQGPRAIFRGADRKIRGDYQHALGAVQQVWRGKSGAAIRQVGINRHEVQAAVKAGSKLIDAGAQAFVGRRQAGVCGGGHAQVDVEILQGIERPGRGTGGPCAIGIGDDTGRGPEYRRQCRRIEGGITEPATRGALGQQRMQRHRGTVTVDRYGAGGRRRGQAMLSRFRQADQRLCIGLFTQHAGILGVGPPMPRRFLDTDQRPFVHQPAQQAGD